VQILELARNAKAVRGAGKDQSRRFVPCAAPHARFNARYARHADGCHRRAIGPRRHQDDGKSNTHISRRASSPTRSARVPALVVTEDRQLFGLIFGAQSLGRIFDSPPEMPPERMQALRQAFMADQQFLAEANTTQIDIVPNTGEEVAALIARYSATPKPVVERAKRAFDPN
jgi:hypothetical protein